MTDLSQTQADIEAAKHHLEDLLAKKRGEESELLEALYGLKYGDKLAITAPDYRDFGKHSGWKRKIGTKRVPIEIIQEMRAQYAIGVIFPEVLKYERPGI